MGIFQVGGILISIWLVPLFILSICSFISEIFKYIINFGKKYISSFFILVKNKIFKSLNRGLKQDKKMVTEIKKTELSYVPAYWTRRKGHNIVYKEKYNLGLENRENENNNGENFHKLLSERLGWFDIIQ